MFRLAAEPNLCINVTAPVSAAASLSPPGMIAAPVFYAYLKAELVARKLV
jgi:hypothetical protein